MFVKEVYLSNKLENISILMWLLLSDNPKATLFDMDFPLFFDFFLNVMSLCWALLAFPLGWKIDLQAS